MGKYPVFALVALIFIGIIKLLQVTVFDADQYGKYRKMSFTSVEAKKDTTQKAKKEEKPIDSVEKVSEPEQLIAESDTIASFESVDESTEEINNETPDQTDDIQEETFASQFVSLEDLKRNYLNTILEELPPGQLREDIVVRYYRHEKDGNKVYVLRDLGYYIHEKEATETMGLGSNVLIYGDDVPIEDIQIVAYTLLDQGLPLKAIEPTQFDWKSTSLEVGTDTLLLSNSVLTDTDIQNFSK